MDYRTRKFGADVQDPPNWQEAKERLERAKLELLDASQRLQKALSEPRGSHGVVLNEEEIESLNKEVEEKLEILDEAENHEKTTSAHISQHQWSQKLESVDETRQNIKFGIVIATYYAKDGSTAESLTETINSVLSQTYENWVIVLVGDKYEDKEEFDRLAALVPEDKIISINLDVAVERDLFFNKTKDSNGNLILENHWGVWMLGGSNAGNVGKEILEERGIKHYVHLDHDDLFEKQHLYNLFYAYSMFPEAALVFTQGGYFGGVLPAGHWLPADTPLETLEDAKLPDGKGINLGINNHPPQFCNTVNSSTSYRIDRFKFKNPEFNGEHFMFMGDKLSCNLSLPGCAADGLIWGEFHRQVSQNDLKYFHIPICTANKGPKGRMTESVHIMSELI